MQSWKGHLPTETVVGNIRPLYMDSTIYTHGIARPLKIYRQGRAHFSTNLLSSSEEGTTDPIENYNNRRWSATNRGLVDQLQNQAGRASTVSDPNTYPNTSDPNTQQCIVSNILPIVSATETPQPTNWVSMANSQAMKARMRVVSGNATATSVNNHSTCIINPNSVQQPQQQAKYFYSSKERLDNRGLTYERKSFHYFISPESTQENKYAGQGNTCSSVTFKPSNTLFSQDGAVVGSAYTKRVQVDTLRRASYYGQPNSVGMIAINKPNICTTRNVHVYSRRPKR
jgi:hypothetical protein